MSRALIPFTEITAAAVMAALEAGRSIGAITTGRDGGPLVARLYKLREYMVANPEWARAIEPLIKKNFVAAQKQKGHNRNQTHCKRGHDLAIHAYPNRPNGIWRKCRLCNDMRAKMGGEPKPELVARVKAALEAGNKISDLTKAGQPGYIVKHPTLMRMKREIPEVGQLIDRRLTQYYTGTVTEDRVRSVLEGLSHGMTLHQLTTRSTPAYLPTTEPVVNFAGLYKFMEKHPTLGKRMRALSAKNA